MSEMIEWVERAALENLRFRLQNAETLAKDASSLLMLLLGGMGAALAYSVRALESGAADPAHIGVFAVMGWLLLSCLVLVWQCILTMPLQAPTNEPDNLMQPGYEFEVIRRAELNNIQARINEAVQRNHHVAAWLDRVRIAVTISPMVFALTAWAWAAR